MSKFKVIMGDPLHYRKEIVQFWDAYLPGTPPERFDWMQDNPAGPAIWFFAIEEGSSRFAGALSIMPKELLLNGRVVRAGMLGDYMIGGPFRVFGPALDLQKAVIKNFSDLGFGLIYTIPNEASLKIIQRMGYAEMTRLYSLVKPIKALPYLKRYINPAVARIVAPIADLVMKIGSKETYVASEGVFEETSSAGDSFDRLWKSFGPNHRGIIGDHSSAFLMWKYFQNPLKKFRVLGCKKDEKGDLLGYAFFAVQNDRMEIADIITLQKSCANGLLKQLIAKARRENCTSIGIMLSEDNSWLRRLKGFLFLDAKNYASVYGYGEKDVVSQPWQFFEGERNI
jgi:hypothetical protein